MNQQSVAGVRSFEVGVLSVRGVYVGACIRFSRFGAPEVTTHWPAAQLSRLMHRLHMYIEEIGSSAFMLRAKHDPSLVEGLAADHPYHTVMEKPPLTQEEIGASSPATRVSNCSFSAREDGFLLRCKFAASQPIELPMHEYTAFSLWAYIDAVLTGYRTLSGPHVGSVQ